MGLPIISSNATESLDDVIANNSSLFKCNPELEDCYTPYADRPETYIVPVVFAIIFVVGVLGNGTLVVIFMRHRAMRNIPNTWVFWIFNLNNFN